MSGWSVAQTAPTPPRAEQQPVPSQQPATVGGQKNSYSLRINSQLVTLDVVVTDRKGAPVSGLSQGDFKVFENAVEQPIVSLEEVRDTGPAAVPIHSTAELDRMEPQAPVSILVLDEVTSKVEDEAFARYALKKYLAGEGDVLSEPTMLLAISAEHQMLLHDYTTSRKEILDALNRHFAGPDWRTGTANPQGHQITATLLSLMGVAGATAGHEGHKNIVWIGRGFPSFEWDHVPVATAEQLHQAIASCTNRLRDARATLYSVDPAGMASGPPMAHADPDALDNAALIKITDPFGGQVDFDAMARATGGMALHGENDVDHLIEGSVAYGKTFYTIAYKPTVMSNDAKEFRSIQVVTTDRRLSITAPEGYFRGVLAAAPVMDAEGKVPTGVAHDLGVANDGLMIYDGVPLTIERIKEKAGNFTVAFPASALAWVADGAEERGDITLLVSSYDGKGRLLHREGHVIGFTRQPLKAHEVESRTLHVQASIETAAPAARVRVVVRVNQNGKIGTGNYFLPGRAN